MSHQIFQNKWFWLLVGIIIGGTIVYLFADSAIKKNEKKASDDMKQFLSNHADAKGQEIYDIFIQDIK